MKTRFFRNMFLWGKTNIKATVSINARATTLLDLDRMPTLTDTNAVLKLDVNTPIRDEGLGTFLQVGAMCEVLFPATNNFFKHIVVHDGNLAHFQGMWVSTKLEGGGYT